MGNGGQSGGCMMLFIDFYFIIYVLYAYVMLVCNHILKCMQDVH
jgi:hypothetical protein